MRLAVLVSLAHPLRQAAQSLIELGHEVHLIDFQTGRSVAQYLKRDDAFQKESIDKLVRSAAGMHLLRSRFRSEFRYLFGVGQLRSICRNIRPDAILSLYGGGWATMAYLSGIRPYMVYVVGSDVLLATGARRTLSRCSLTRASWVFATGQHLAARTRELAPRARVVPLYLGIDPDRFVPAEKPCSPIRIVCSRGFMPVYNNGYLVQALSVLGRRGLDFVATFTSTGPDLGKTREMANRLFMPETLRRVRFLGGISDEALIKELQQAHIYVSVSRSDGTSISLLEALSCGLYPVLSDIPQNREWIEPTIGNGLLVPLERTDILADALMDAMTNAEQRKRVARFNRELVLRRAHGRRNMATLVAHHGRDSVPTT